MSNKGNAARLGAAAASIARGAAGGGLHGAALGAVKAFLPEIVKGIIIAVVILLLLPLVVFSAIPNVIFGYHSAQAQDIIVMTDIAYSLDVAYSQLESYSQQQIDRLIAEIKSAYTDGESGPAYDQTDVTSKTGNTGVYWLIAITSVAYNQDLFAMSEDSVKDMAMKKLTYTAGITTRTEGEGEEAVVIRTLKIDIEDLTPDQLMDKLGFSQEERNWAYILYATLAQEQYVGFADSDGAGWYNTDYGDITFTDASVEVVYYNQTDSRWGNILYGKSSTIGQAGCGPTALAMAVASLTDNMVTPLDVAKWSADNGYRAEGNGSYHSLIPAGGAHYGLTVEGLGSDGRKVAAALAEGKLVIAIMSRGHFTSSGHFIVLRGTTAEGNILVADPSSIKRSNQEWSLSLIVNEANRGAGAGGPFWSLAVP